MSPVDADITALLDNAMNESKVFINGSLMISGSTYTFKLGKFHWLSRQFEHYTRKNAQVVTSMQTSCNKSVHKLVTSCVRTACS